MTTVFNIVNEQTRRKVENPVAKVLEQGNIVGLANHTLLVRKDGTEVPIDDSGAPIRDPNGKTLGVVLVFRDITERKQGEEALKESEERFKAIAETTPMSIGVTKISDGKFLYSNTEYQKMFGYSEHELFNKVITQGVYWDLRRRKPSPSNIERKWQR